MNTIVNEVFAVLPIFVVAIIAHFILHKALSVFYNVIVKQAKTKFDDTVFPLIRRIVGSLVWIIAGVMSLQVIGYDMSGLTATLSIGSLISGYFVKNSITNILAGFTLMMDRPFIVGDGIILPSGEEATVEKVGLKRSWFQYVDNSGHLAIISVPNTQLTNVKIINYDMVERGV